MSTVTSPDPPALTSTQGALLALHNDLDNPAPLNMHFVVEVEGPFQVAAFREAVWTLLDNHEALRTLLQSTGPTESVPRVLSTAEARERWDVGLMVEYSLAGALREAASARASAFRLDAELPLRCTVHQVDTARFLVVLTLHHAVADGWTMHLLCTQLASAYARAVASSGPPAAAAEDTTPPSMARGIAPGGRALAPTSPSQPWESARRQTRWLHSSPGHEQLSWWVRQLHTPHELGPALDAAADPDRADRCPPARAAAVALRRLVRQVPPDTARHVKELARDLSVSLFCVLATAFAIARHVSGASDSRLLTLTAGRVDGPSTQCVGALYNPVVLDLTISADQDLLTHVLNTAAVVVDALEHQGVPFALVRSHVIPGPQPVCAAFVLDHHPMRDLRLAGCTSRALTDLRSSGSDPNLSRGDITWKAPDVPSAGPAAMTLAVRERADQLTVNLLYNPAAVDDAVAQQTLESFFAVLDLLLDSSHLTVAEAADTIDPVDSIVSPPASLPTGETPVYVDQLAAVDAVSPAYHPLTTHRNPSP